MIGAVLLTGYRLFPAMVRFDMAYVTIMNCNWKHIRYDYPNLHRWLRQLYWEADQEAQGSEEEKDPPSVRVRRHVGKADFHCNLWKDMQNPP